MATRIFHKFVLFCIIIFAATTNANDYDNEDADSSSSEDSTILRQIRVTGITVPGTRWCGPGNTTNRYTELGESRKEDKCCRAHDYCDEVMEARKSLHGLHNPDWVVRLKCSCEAKFRSCLQKANTLVSHGLGHAYFNTRAVCFDYDYPIVRCKLQQQSTVARGQRCLEYELDTKRSKIWQFFDVPFYNVDGDSVKSFLARHADKVLDFVRERWED